MCKETAQTYIADVLALHCGSGELRCVPPNTEEEKHYIDRSESSTTGTKRLTTIFKGSYIYIYIYKITTQTNRISLIHTYHSGMYNYIHAMYIYIQYYIYILHVYDSTTQFMMVINPSALDTLGWPDRSCYLASWPWTPAMAMVGKSSNVNPGFMATLVD